jgi:hypothetical protein
MMLRDDDEPHRNTQTSTNTTNAGAVPSGNAGETISNNPNDHGATFESEATFVLGEVIDRTTIESLASASRSGDPARRADGAKHARDAVAARLDQLRKKRQQIELRAQQLRAKH